MWNWLQRVFRPSQSPAQEPELAEGGLYSHLDEDGRYGVLKILKIDDGGVHLRLYSNRFAEHPASVDESKLFMAGINEQPPQPLGMGHIPVSRRSFATWQIRPIQMSSVSDEELDGYRMWEEANGGYF